MDHAGGSAHPRCVTRAGSAGPRAPSSIPLSVATAGTGLTRPRCSRLRSDWASRRTRRKSPRASLIRRRELRGRRAGAHEQDRARSWLSRAQRAAGIEVTGAIHRLRHTFSSMLAAEGAPPLAIQELAGHSHITTTMKYMHLSPTTRGAAIALLDRARMRRPKGGRRGDIVEMEVPSEAKRNRSA